MCVVWRRDGQATVGAPRPSNCVFQRHLAPNEDSLFADGLPLIVNGKTVGAIGRADVTGSEAVAKVGVDAFQARQPSDTESRSTGTGMGVNTKRRTKSGGMPIFHWLVALSCPPKTGSGT